MNFCTKALFSVKVPPPYPLPVLQTVPLPKGLFLPSTLSHFFVPPSLRIFRCPRMTTCTVGRPSVGQWRGDEGRWSRGRDRAVPTIDTAHAPCPSPSPNMYVPVPRCLLCKTGDVAVVPRGVSPDLHQRLPECGLFPPDGDK